MFMTGANIERCQIRRPVPQGQEQYATDPLKYEEIAGCGVYEIIRNDLPIIFVEPRNIFDQDGFPLTEAVYYGKLQKKIKKNEKNIPRFKDVVFRRKLKDGKVDLTDDGRNRPELSHDRLVVNGVRPFGPSLRLVLVNQDRFTGVGRA